MQEVVAAVVFHEILPCGTLQGYTVYHELNVVVTLSMLVLQPYQMCYAGEYAACEDSSGCVAVNASAAGSINLLYLPEQLAYALLTCIQSCCLVRMTAMCDAAALCHPTLVPWPQDICGLHNAHGCMNACMVLFCQSRSSLH